MQLSHQFDSGGEDVLAGQLLSTPVQHHVFAGHATHATAPAFAVRPGPQAVHAVAPSAAVYVATAHNAHGGHPPRAPPLPPLPPKGSGRP